MIFRLASPEKRHNNEKPPLEEEKKEKIELKSITSDGETNTATKVIRDMQNKSLKELFYEAKKVCSQSINVTISLCSSTWTSTAEMTVRRRILILPMII